MLKAVSPMIFRLRRSTLVLTLVGSAYLSGCATLPAGEQDLLGARIEQAIGERPSFDGRSSKEVSDRVAALLAEPITPETAARIAIANNPRVQMAYAELGVARANFLDGVLPSNPVIHAARLVPKAPETDILKYGFGIDLMSLLTLPARRNAAQGGWEAARARAIGETLMVAANARIAMIELIAANQNLDLMRQANDASQAALVAAEAIFAAGNSAPLDVERERLFAAEMALTLRQAEARVIPARERVNAALGLSEDQRQSWSAARRLPAPPDEAIAVDAVVAEVVTASTDVATAKAMLQAARAVRSTSGLASLFPGLELSGERERDGIWKRGFGLSVGLPVFGLGTSTRLRAQSMMTLANANLTSLELELGAEARSAAAMAEATRQMAIERREVILPLSAQVFTSTQLNFNAMQLGIFQLLEAKRARLDAGRMSIDATRDYWIAQANLDLLRQGGRGGSQPLAQVDTTQMPKPAAGH